MTDTTRPASDAVQARKRAHARPPEATKTRQRNTRRLLAVALLIVAVVAILATLGSNAPNKALASAAARKKVPYEFVPAVHSSLVAYNFAGTAAKLPLPSRGQGAVEVAGLGVVGETAHQRCVPVASLTKIMTAYIILQDHPLVGNGNGPEFTMTKADHQAWIEASEAGDSNIMVVAGEHLDERQLLQALIIPSADNIADYLAVWDAGSIPAFVAKMNAEAHSLGLGCTHYADPAGVNPASMSTAGFMAKLAGIAMQNPELRSVTDELSIRLPETGEIWNEYNPAIGVDGIIGVKSGFTSKALSCLVTAAWRTVGGHRVLVVSAVTGQNTSLYGAALVDEGLLDAVTKELRVATVVPAAAQVASATTGWSKQEVPVRVGPQAMMVVGWPGLSLSLVLLENPLTPTAGGWKAGTIVAEVEINGSLGTWFAEPASLAGDVVAPPSNWTPPSRALRS